MKSRFRFLVFMLAVIFAGEVFAQSPVTNMRVQRIDTVIVVFYDLAATANVEAFASLDNGASFIGPLKHVTGAVGNNVLSGKDKILMWHIVTEVGDLASSNVQFRLVTDAMLTTSVLSEGNLIARGWKVYQYDLNLLNDLLLVGDKAYQLRKPLTTDEVRHVMANSNALQFYNKGVKRNRNGNIWMITGGGLAVAGVVIGLTRPYYSTHKWTETGWWDSDVRWYNGYYHNRSYYWGTESSYDFYEYRDYRYIGKKYLYNDDIAVIAIVAGATAICTGVVLKLVGKNLIHRSVDMHNSGRPLSRLEYDFTFTGNGAHLAIRF